MKNKQIQKWALFAEILSAVAVVISLGFVGYQLQQSNEQAALNTQALERAAYQQLIDRISEFNLTTIQSPELRSARQKVESGVELTTDETSVINAFLFLAYRNGDLAYLQYQQGIIDEQRLLSGLGLLINYLYYPWVQAHWERLQVGFVDSYRDYINQLIVEIKQGEANFDSATRQRLLDLTKQNRVEAVTQ
ncbi:MAG: hypothetical protein V3T31_00700 [candidate division Zixibacteria bacterium]